MAQAEACDEARRAMLLLATGAAVPPLQDAGVALLRDARQGINREGVMGRFDDEGEEQFPGQYELWEANLRRSIAGKKGQSALRDLRDALLALPHPRLIYGHLAAPDDGSVGVCAIGALVAYRRERKGESREEVLRALIETVEGIDPYDSWEGQDVTVSQARAVGVPSPLAYDIGSMNDLHYGLTPEERHAKMLAWVESKIKPEAANV